jgi:CRP-like cAMP-binding protein
MGLEDDIAFFEQVPPLAALGKQALRILAIGAETRHLQSGAVLFYAGELADGGYVVQEGSLLLEPGTLSEGKEITVGRYHSIFADPVRLPSDFIVTAETEDGVIMAFEHRKEPIAAVQFHPESIMTLGHNAGMRIIENIVAHLPRKAKEKAA